jgi:hypothetical protein
MKREKFEIANIYVPVKRRSTLKPELVQQIAQSMLESGQETPILVRRDGDRLVLVHDLHWQSSSVRTSFSTGQWGVPTRRTSLSQEMVVVEGMLRPFVADAILGHVASWGDRISP